MLIYHPLEKRVAILANDNFKCIFLNGMIEFRFEFHWNFFPRVHTDLGNGLAPNRWQGSTWTNADPVHRRIYATLGGDEILLHALSTVSLDSNYVIWVKTTTQGIYSISGLTSYRNITWSLEAARFGFKFFPIALRLRKHRNISTVEMLVNIRSDKIIV